MTTKTATMMKTKKELGFVQIFFPCNCCQWEGEGEGGVENWECERLDEESEDAGDGGVSSRGFISSSIDL